MLKVLRKIIASLLVVILVCSSITFMVFAGDEGGSTKKDLIPIDDKKHHNALEWNSYGTPSQKAKQAFVIGWNIRFSSKVNPNYYMDVYIPRYIKDWSAAPQKYRYPLTEWWDFGSYPTLNMSATPNDFIKRYVSPYKKSKDEVETELQKFEKIIVEKEGFHAIANACIQKFTYSPNRTQKYQPIVGDNNIANTKDELLDRFTEYKGSDFLSTAVDQCYNINFDLPPEKPNLADPVVKITQPEDNSNVYLDEDTQIIGVGHNCHHIHMKIKEVSTNNTVDLGTIYNPQDYTKDMTGTWKYKFPRTGYYQLILEGRNTANDTDNGSEPATPDVHRVYATQPDGAFSYIYVTYLKSGTNEEFKDMASRISCKLNDTRSIKVVQSIGDYNYCGSAVTDSFTIPLETKDTTNPINVTITNLNVPKHVYIWFDETIPPPPPPNNPPTARIDNDVYKVAGQNVHMTSRNSSAYNGATIKSSDWTLPTAMEPSFGNENGATNVYGDVWYPAPNTYNIDLKVTDSRGMTDSAISSVLIDPPCPFANISASGLMKENRKVTLDASESTCAAIRFPIDWSATTWTITPDLSSGATWDFGIRLEDGRVFKTSGSAIYSTTGEGHNTYVDVASINTLLNGQKKFDFQARNKGQYIITLKIKASLDSKYTYSGTRDYDTTISKTLFITEDTPPIADFTMPATILRDIPNPTDPENGIKYARGKVTCTSTSEDGDTIGKRVWQYKYDANNNGNLAEDSTTSAIYVEDLDSATSLVAKSTNDPAPTLQTYVVGAFYFRLTVTEAIPDDTTIKELLLPSDYRTSTKSEW